jgi:hypothetical protein
MCLSSFARGLTKLNDKLLLMIENAIRTEPSIALYIYSAYTKGWWVCLRRTRLGGKFTVGFRRKTQRHKIIYLFIRVVAPFYTSDVFAAAVLPPGLTLADPSYGCLAPRY